MSPWFVSRLKDSQRIPQTGMVILDVGVLSGFSLSPGAAPTDLIRMVEVLPEKVSFYLDSVSVRMCPFIQMEMGHAVLFVLFLFFIE